jgi:hypothetical protein
MRAQQVRAQRERSERGRITRGRGVMTRTSRSSLYATRTASYRSPPRFAVDNARRVSGRAHPSGAGPVIPASIRWGRAS